MLTMAKQSNSSARFDWQLLPPFPTRESLFRLNFFELSNNIYFKLVLIATGKTGKKPTTHTKPIPLHQIFTLLWITYLQILTWILYRFTFYLNDFVRVLFRNMNHQS
jgi:hypothetical protein